MRRFESVFNRLAVKADWSLYVFTVNSPCSLHGSLSDSLNERKIKSAFKTSLHHTSCCALEAIGSIIENGSEQCER